MHTAKDQEDADERRNKARYARAKDPGSTNVVMGDDDGLIYSGEGDYIHGCTVRMGTSRTTTNERSAGGRTEVLGLG